MRWKNLLPGHDAKESAHSHSLEETGDSYQRWPWSLVLLWLQSPTVSPLGRDKSAEKQRCPSSLREPQHSILASTEPDILENQDVLWYYSTILGTPLETCEVGFLVLEAPGFAGRGTQKNKCNLFLKTHWKHLQKFLKKTWHRQNLKCFGVRRWFALRNIYLCPVFAYTAVTTILLIHELCSCGVKILCAVHTHSVKLYCSVKLRCIPGD